MKFRQTSELISTTRPVAEILKGEGGGVGGRPYLLEDNGLVDK